MLHEQLAALWRHRWFDAVALVALALLLFLLWLPGLTYPVVTDTSYYALLGESLWRHGTYEFLGNPRVSFLPGQAFFSYPFVALAGYTLGMKLSTLVAAIGVLFTSFLVLRQALSRVVALLASACLVLHPNFIFMSIAGASDLLFTWLILLSLLLYMWAKQNPHLYVGTAIVMGLACLTRFNGYPIFLLFTGYTLLFRRSHFKNRWFWMSLPLFILVVSPWFIRNALLFDNALDTKYDSQLPSGIRDLFLTLVSNIAYYLQPIHNVLPVLFPFVLVGLWREGKRQFFLILFMLASWSLALIWWNQGMRHVFPGYPILLGFAATGVCWLFMTLPRVWKLPFALLFATVFICVHATALCVYSYGQCNAWFDRTIGLIPARLGTTPEGIYSQLQAWRYINASVETGAIVRVDLPEDVIMFREHFRSDIQLGTAETIACPYYDVVPPSATGTVLYVTPSEPLLTVMKHEC